MAENILNAQKLAFACRSIDVIGMAVTINEQVVHPPVFSIMALPFMLVIRDPGTAIFCLNGVLLCILLFLVFSAAWRLRPSSCDGYSHAVHIAPAILATAFGAGSILARVFSAIAMTELAGAVFVLGSAVSAIQADCSCRKKWYALTGICMSLAFLTKYSYGVFACPSVLWLVIRHALANKALGRMAARGWFLLLPIFVCIIGRVLNSYDETALSRFGVSERGVSNVVYTLIITTGIGMVYLYGRMNGTCRDRLGPCKALILSSVVPVWIWLILPSPNRILGVIRFFRNRTSLDDRLDSIGFYPRVVVQDYDIRPWIGVLVVSGVVAAAGWLIIGAVRRCPEANGLYCYSFFCGLIVLASHRYKLERNLLPLMPLLWICASWGIVRTLHFIRVRGTALTTLAFLIAVVIFIGLSGSGLVPERLNAYSALPESDRIIDTIVQNLDVRRKNHVWGANNHISQPAILSRCLEMGYPVDVIQFDPRKPKGESCVDRVFSDPNEAAKNFRIWMDQNIGARVVVIDMRQDCPMRDEDYLRWNQWKEEYTRMLRLSPEFQMTAQMSFCQDRIHLYVMDRY